MVNKQAIGEGLLDSRPGYATGYTISWAQEKFL